MRDFIFHNPVKIYFGKGQARHIAQEVERVEGAVLVVYGGGSIKRNGASCPALRRTRDWTKRWKAYDWSRSMASA